MVTSCLAAACIGEVLIPPISKAIKIDHGCRLEIAFQHVNFAQLTLHCASQINKRGKWDEVVSALQLESTAPTIATQVQRLYAHLLYNFEQSIARTRSAPKPPAVSDSFSGICYIS